MASENVYAYMIEGHDSSTTTFSSIWDADDIERLAEDAAEYEWDNRDGWEWMAKNSPLTVAIYDTHGALLGRSAVLLEAQMTFHGSAAKPAGGE